MQHVAVATWRPLGGYCSHHSSSCLCPHSHVWCLHLLLLFLCVCFFVSPSALGPQNRCCCGVLVRKIGLGLVDALGSLLFALWAAQSWTLRRWGIFENMAVDVLWCACGKIAGFVKIVHPCRYAIRRRTRCRKGKKGGFCDLRATFQATSSCPFSRTNYCENPLYLLVSANEPDVTLFEAPELVTQKRMVKIKSRCFPHGLNLAQAY